MKLVKTKKENLKKSFENKDREEIMKAKLISDKSKQILKRKSSKAPFSDFDLDDDFMGDM